MKKGLTFAELMICLVVISVITAVLYPMVAQFNPNVNKPLAKSAYKTLTSIVAEIVNGNQDGILPASALNFCTAFCEKANVLGQGNSTCSTLCTNNSNKIVTSNGMRWSFPDSRIVIVDVNASNNSLTSGAGFVETYWDEGSFYYANDVAATATMAKSQDTFQFVFNENGTIDSMSPVMWQHLEDKSADY